MTCATLYKLISWSKDVLNVRKRQFCVKCYFHNATKIAIFTPKFLENGFERLWKRKNRRLLTFGATKIDPSIVWSFLLILWIPHVPNKFSKAIRCICKNKAIFVAHSKANHDVSLKGFFDTKHAIFEESPSKTWKLTTDGRLRTPKHFEMSYDHAKHFVG